MGNVPQAIPFEPTHDIYHYAGNPLDKIFAPKSVALVGATEKHGTVGRTILWNLISSLEPAQQSFRRHHLPDQSQSPERAGHQGLSEYRGRAGESRPGRLLYACSIYSRAD